MRMKSLLVFSLVTFSLLVSSGAVRANRTSGQEIPQISFKGRVLDRQGQPLSDVKLALYELRYARGEDLPRAEFIREATTGSDGAFGFARDKESPGERQGSIVAHKEGLSLGWTIWEMQEGDQQSDIMLGEPRELSGAVVDEGGTPIIDAEVSIAIAIIGTQQDHRYISYFIAPQLLTVRTDSTGRFVFPNLPGEATCELLASKPGRTTTCTLDPTTYRGDKCQFSPGQSGIKVTLPVESRIEGMVVEKADGKPIAGVAVTAQPAQRGFPLTIEPVTSAQDGTFFIGALSAGSYTLQLASREDKVAEWVAEPVKVSLKAGETVRDVRLVLSKGAFVEVGVKEQAGGRPIAQVNINVHDPASGQRFNGVTDENGSVRIRLPAGSYQINSLYKEGYARSEESVEFTVADGQTKQLELTLSGLPSVRGVVYDDAGQPLEGATVQTLPGGRGKDAVSNAEGKFEVTWDTQGWSADRTVFYIVGRHVDRNLAAAQPVEEQGTQIALKLQPAATLTGQVVDPNGKGIENAQLLVMLRGSSWGASFLPRNSSVRTNAQGQFEVSAIPPEQRYYLTAMADGYGQMQNNLNEDQAVAGRVQTGTFTLPVANLSVSGVVVDSEGEPVSGASVYCYGGSQDNQPNREVRTNAEGKFTLERVCAGRIGISASSQSGGAYLRGSVQTEGGAKDVQIVVSERSSATRYVPRSPTRLIGKLLPDLKSVGIELPADASDRGLLVCLWDMNQRPSRHCIGEMVRRAAALSEKGVTIVAVHAAKAEEGALEKWVEQNKPPFPVGCFTGDVEKTLLDWGAASLPHLILTDRKHTVVAEGFELSEELDRKVEQTSAR